MMARMEKKDCLDVGKMGPDTGGDDREGGRGSERRVEREEKKEEEEVEGIWLNLMAERSHLL